MSEKNIVSEIIPGYKKLYVTNAKGKILSEWVNVEQYRRVNILWSRYHAVLKFMGMKNPKLHYIHRLLGITFIKGDYFSYLRGVVMLERIKKDGHKRNYTVEHV